MVSNFLLSVPRSVHSIRNRRALEMPLGRGQPNAVSKGLIHNLCLKYAEFFIRARGSAFLWPLSPVS